MHQWDLVFKLSFRHLGIKGKTHMTSKQLPGWTEAPPQEPIKSRAGFPHHVFKFPLALSHDFPFLTITAQMPRSMREN